MASPNESAQRKGWRRFCDSCGKEFYVGRMWERSTCDECLNEPSVVIYPPKSEVLENLIRECPNCKTPWTDGRAYRDKDGKRVCANCLQEFDLLWLREVIV
jgi:hypothetical protein